MGRSRAWIGLGVEIFRRVEEQGQGDCREGRYGAWEKEHASVIDRFIRTGSLDEDVFG
jgi:hypothetical protein